MDYFNITEVTDGGFFAGDFFQRAFGEPLPDWGRHLVAFYRKNATHYIPLGYLNYLPHESVMLVGGGVTNGAAFSAVDPSHAREIRSEGGVFYLMLTFGFRHFADDCEAFFGYAGDDRARAVDLTAGFEATEHEHLIVNFHRPISRERRQALIAQLNALGPF